MPKPRTQREAKDRWYRGEQWRFYTFLAVIGFCILARALTPWPPAAVAAIAVTANIALIGWQAITAITSGRLPRDETDPELNFNPPEQVAKTIGYLFFSALILDNIGLAVTFAATTWPVAMLGSGMLLIGRVFDLASTYLAARHMSRTA